MEKLRYISVLILSSIFLISAAIYNGYPIVYSDTSTYLVSGFELIPPFDRPITYGIFLRISSLNGLTLWSSILFQAMALAWPVNLLIREFTGFRRHYLLSLGIVGLLSGLTAVSFVSSNLIADMFSPASLLCLILIFTGKGINKRERLGLYILFFLSHGMHLSHLAVNLLFLAMLTGVRKLGFRDLFIPAFYRNILIAFLLMVLAFPLMSAPIAKFQHVFFMGKMAENGILYEYLEENCPDHEFQLCRYKDSLPDNASDFVWAPDGPVNGMGGWKVTRDEFRFIIRETLTSPHYLLRHMEESIRATIQQFGYFRAGDGNGAFREGTLLYERILKYIPRKADGYYASRQNRQGALQPGLKGFNMLSAGAMIASLIFLVLCPILPCFRQRIQKKEWMLLVLLCGAILIHTAVNASLGTVIDRYGAKIMWFLPLAALLFISQIIYKFIRTSSKQP